MMRRTALWVGLLSVACGGGPITHRFVDTEVGVTDAYGAPRYTRYAAYTEAQRAELRINVMEVSECDKLRMKVVHRVDETLRDGKVVDRSPATQIQKPAGTDGVVPCNERWARNVWVGLRIGDQTFRLGAPDARGQVIANLSGEIQAALYGETPPDSATIIVSGVDAGTISLAPYTSHEARLTRLLDSMRELLSKEDSAITKEDIARSYELYEQIGKLDLSGDPRVAGLRTRFLELLYQRKQLEATETMKRNIKALNEAKNLLPTLAAGAVPPFMLSSVQGGLTSPEAILWARAQVALAVHQYPALCAGGPFGWSRVTGDLSAVSRLAFSYLRFAYNDPFQLEVQRVCGRL